MNDRIRQIFRFKKKERLSDSNLEDGCFEDYIKGLGDEMFDKFVESLISLKGKEYDYTKQGWGHSFKIEKKIGEYVKYGYGFGSASRGDILLLNLANAKVGKFLILNIKYESDPVDMFWAYVIGIGYKES